MGMLLTTDWRYDTSEEKNVFAFLGFHWGKLYFTNTSTGEKLTLKYRLVDLNVGVSAVALPAQMSWSETSDPSGAFNNVGVMPGRYFGSLAFPCNGYMLGASAAAGFLAGKARGMEGLTMVIFGVDPVFAAIRIWGKGRAVMPGAGLSGGVAVYESV